MDRVSDRSEILFGLHVELGPARSLKLLHERLSTLGATVSLATLKRYSARFDWQARLAELAAESSGRRREGAIEQMSQVNERHLQLARALLGAGGTALQRLLGSEVRLASLKPNDIARLLDLGLRAERQTMMLEVDRKQVGIAIWNDVLTNVVELYRAANEVEDPLERTSRFADGLDALVQDRLDALEKEGRS